MSKTYGTLLAFLVITALPMRTPIVQAAEVVPGSIPATFSVTLSGSSTYAVPIKIAPGAAGTEPKIQLTYDSQAPTGALGAGWSISGLSVITRGPKSAAIDGEQSGVNFDEADALYLDGQRLIPISQPKGSGASRTIEFRKVTDDQTRIIQVGATIERSYFQIQSKGGVILILGNFENVNNKPDNSIIRFSDGKVLGFAESVAADTVGNFITFDYNSDQLGDHNIARIDYTGLGHVVTDSETGVAQTLVKDLCPFASIRFKYKTDNSRSQESFISGHQIVSRVRLEEIASEVADHRFDVQAGCDPSSIANNKSVHRVSRYSFEYENVTTANRYNLKKLHMFGEDDVSELSPTAFTYTPQDIGWNHNPFEFPNSAVLAENGRLGAGYRFVHFNPEGGRAADLVFAVSNNTGLLALAFKNQGITPSTPLWTKSAGFEPPIPFVDAAGNDLGVIVADIQGEGREALLQNNITGETHSIAAYLAGKDSYVSDDLYKLPFVVSKDGKIVARYKFGFWSGGKGPDLIYKSGAETGFLQNAGPDIGWKRRDTLTPPVDLNDKTYLVDLECNGGKPALIGSRSDEQGNLQWAVFRFKETYWAPEKADSVFIPPFPVTTDPESIRQLKLDDAGKYCDGFIVSDARSAQKSAAYIASSAGWKRIESKAPPFDLIDKGGHPVKAVVADIDGDGRDDVIANQRYSDGTSIAFAFRQSTTGWINAPAFKPPLLGTESSFVPGPYYIGEIDGRPGVDIVLTETAEALPQDSAAVVAKIFTSERTGFRAHPDLAGPIAFSRKDKKDLGVRFIDLHGRGLPDIIVSRRVTEGATTRLLSAAYRNTGAGWQKEPGDCSTPEMQDIDHPTGLCPPLPFAGDDITGNPVQFVDLDGDGIADMIYSYKDKAGATTTKFFLNVADPKACRECRRWSNIEIEHSDLKFLEDGLDVFPLASYRIGDMGVRFAKFDANRLGVMVGFRGAGSRECHRTGRRERRRGRSCGTGLGSFSQKAYVFDGTKWKAADNYKPPVPFVTQLDDASGPSVDLALQLVNVSGGSLPDLVANFTDPVVERMPWTHRSPVTNLVWVNHGNGWEQRAQIAVPYPLDAGSREPKTFVQMVDLNGDGLADVVMTKGDNPASSRTWLGTGSGWVERPQWQVPAAAISNTDGDPGYRLVDTKGDGYLDILWMRTNSDGTRSKGLFLNNGTDWSVRGDDKVVPDLTFVDKDGVDQGVRLLSVTGKGLTDIVQAFAGATPVVEINNSRRADVLASIMDGYGLSTSIFYESLLEADGADPKSGIQSGGPLGRFAYERGPPLGYPLASPIPTMYVVRSAQVDEGDGKITRFLYRYGGYIIDSLLTQPLGFRWRESLNLKSGVLNRSEFVQDTIIKNAISRDATCLVRVSDLEVWDSKEDFPADLCPHDKVQNSWGTKIGETRNCWTAWNGDLSGTTSVVVLPQAGECGDGSVAATLSGPSIHQTAITKIISETYEIDGRLVTKGSDSFVYSTSSKVFENHGNVISVLSMKGDGTWIKTENSYDDDAKSWHLGRLTGSVVTKVGDPKSEGQLGRKEERRCSGFVYDDRTGLISDESVNCDQKKAIRTHYERDAFGNVTSKTVSTRGEISQTNLTAFDALGRFSISATDALGHKTEKVNSLTTGLPLQSLDANGLTNSFAYDNFGRLRHQIDPDGVMATTEIIDQGNFPKIDGFDLTDGLTVTARYAVRSQVGSLPLTITLFDRKGRSIRTVSDSFTPDARKMRLVIKDVRYDDFGNVTYSSLPFERGATPLWNISEYDAQNRVCASTAPNGLRTETLFTGLAEGGELVSVVVDPARQLAGTDAAGKAILSCGRRQPAKLYHKGARHQRTSSKINMRKLLTTSSDDVGSVTYEYDAGDRIEKVIGPTGAVTENFYDEYGNKIRVSDPDLGVWEYFFDGFGRVIKQIDAKRQISTLEYDAGNRPKRRVLQDVTTVWNYDDAKNGVGKISSIVSSNGYEQFYTYDAGGRLERDIVKILNEQFVTSKTYDKFGRVESIYYPTSFAVRNTYDGKGFLTAVSNLVSGERYWTADEIDIFGRVVKETFGNGVVTKRAFDEESQRPTTIDSVGPSREKILSLALSYDLLGNLERRSEAVEHKREAFCYDILNRLHSVGDRKCDQVAVSFDAAGRITSKHGAGKYDYATKRTESGAYSTPVHAVQGRRSGRRYYRYSYDLNGNMVKDPEATFSYTSDNRLALIFSKEDKWSRFDYGPDGDRFRQFSRNGAQAEETIYLGGFERVVDFSGTSAVDHLRSAAIFGPERMIRFRHYLSNNVGIFAAVETQKTYGSPVPNLVAGTRKAGGKPSLTGESVTREAWYLHIDQLGSILRVTDQDGRIRERLWYDPWGKRDLSINDKPGRGEKQKLGMSWTRGFTGHEHISSFSLIHMNGRVFNPLLSVFLSVDAVNQMITDTQSGNGYAYARGNSLRYIDPSGMSFFGDAWHAVTAPFRAAGDAIGAIGRGIAHFAGETGKWLSENWRTVVIVAVVVAVSVVTAGAATAAFGPLAGAILSGMAAGAVGGGLGAALYGGGVSDILLAAFKGAVIGGVSAAAFYGVGSYFAAQSSSAANEIGSVAAHGVVGGAKESIEGGDFWKGFIATAATKATSLYPNSASDAVNAARAAVVGGTVAAINGDKFVNGAVLGAFSYAFNDMFHKDGKLWAKKPTVEEYAKHWLGQDGFTQGEPVYRDGSDVNLSEYPTGQFSSATEGQRLPFYPSSSALAAALANFELGTLPTGPLTDTFLYGSMSGTVVGGGQIQLRADTFNFNMEGRGLRDVETWIQWKRVVGGQQGKDFQTIFVGPSKIPGR